MSIADRIAGTRAVGAARTAYEWLAPRAAPYVTWAAQHAPIFGSIATLRRRRVVLEPYGKNPSLVRSLVGLVTPPVLILLCLAYGFFFALTAPFLMVPFVVPIAVMVVLIVWALPESRTPPTAPLEFLFPLFFILLILWPDYLAVSLPGLPWITAQRLIGLPMAGLLLVSLSVSKAFRRTVNESVNGIPLLWRFFCAMIVVQIVTTFLSPSPVASAQVVFTMQINLTAVFVISSVLFRDIKYVERYWALLCALAIPIIVLTTYESSRQHIPWAAHIPKILMVPDPSVQVILTPTFRPGIHLYRAKATFPTPLVLAEYLSLLTPYFLHFIFYNKNLIIRVGCALMIPLCFMAIRMTDARLGVVGMLASLLLYGLMWSIVFWRSHPRNLFAAAAVYAYPAAFTLGLIGIFASHRMKIMVLGDGAQASSSAARDNQLNIAMGKLMAAPWGHGTGQCGNAMGYGEGAFVTVDNYFITVSLDYGVMGVIFWYGMFIIAIVQGARFSLSKRYSGTDEARLLAPLTVTFVAFLVIKWVHGQGDMHPMLYMMLGMTSALVLRLRQSHGVDLARAPLSYGPMLGLPYARQSSER